jgi:chromosome segregation ATPase
MTPRLPKPTAGKRCKSLWTNAAECSSNISSGVDNLKASHESPGAQGSSSNVCSKEEMARPLTWGEAHRRCDTSKKRLDTDGDCHFFTPQEKLDEDLRESLRGQLASQEELLRLANEERYALEHRCKKAELERDTLQELFWRKRQELETLLKSSAELGDELRSCNARLAAAETEKQALHAKCEDQSNCVICLDHFADHVVIPCGHLAICRTCSAAAATQCPVCRQSVDLIVQVYRT